MRAPRVRLAVVLVGLAAVVYGGASLTGGWLGTPPWWERDAKSVEERAWWEQPGTVSNPALGPHQVALPGREWISGVVVVIGLALVAFAACPRRPTARRPGVT